MAEKDGAMSAINPETVIDDLADYMEGEHGLDCLEIQNGATALFMHPDDPDFYYELTLERRQV